MAKVIVLESVKSVEDVVSKVKECAGEVCLYIKTLHTSDRVLEQINDALELAVYKVNFVPGPRQSQFMITV